MQQGQSLAGEHALFLSVPTRVGTQAGQLRLQFSHPRGQVLRRSWPCRRRTGDIEEVATVVIRGPMVAVGETPSAAPWPAFSYAPLHRVAKLYRAAGADVHNLPPVSTDKARAREDASTG